ncbi:MAG: hypothetical protein L0K86_22080 [Actinomycetia bacterium]|nr:hypothetical protein [Actinomycetes bacterium]
MADDAHDDVRARLAAEPTPPMPDDVAARLHAALAAEAQARHTPEVTEPEEATTPATVTELPRRVRWKAPLLAAAGVVAVVAIGIPVINQTSDQGSGDGASSGSMAENSTRFNSAEEAPDSGSPNSDQSAPQTGPKSMVDRFRRAPMDLHRASFAADVTGYLGSRSDTGSTSALERDAGTAVSCKGDRPSAPGGLRATLDGDPAVVLASRAKSGGVRVRAVVCGGDGPTVAARATIDRH